MSSSSLRTVSSMEMIDFLQSNLLDMSDPVNNNSIGFEDEDLCEEWYVGNSSDFSMKSLGQLNQLHTSQLNENNFIDGRATLSISYSSTSKEDNDSISSQSSVVEKYIRRKQNCSTVDAKERRRLRNVELARVARLKKKEELELLRAQIIQLKQENDYLRKEASKRMATESISEICSANYTVPFLIVNSIDMEFPILRASPEFLELTGYKTMEVIGKSFRMIHGPQTDPIQVEKLRESLTEKIDSVSRLNQYHANGSKYICDIQVEYYRENNGEQPKFFFAFFRKVNDIKSESCVIRNYKKRSIDKVE
eukprot:gene13450-18034_t